MAPTTIEEARNELAEAAGREKKLKSELSEAQSRAETAERKLSESDARTAAEKFARKHVLEANSTLPALVVDRIVKESLVDVPLTDKHELDEAKFEAAVDEARTEHESYIAGVAESLGAGSITGFGPGQKDGEVSEADFDAEFTTKPKEA